MMERLDSFTRSNNRLEDIKSRLFFLFTYRKYDFTCLLKLKNEGRESWHILILDCNKKREFFETYRHVNKLDITYFGKVLESGIGHEIPETLLNNKMNKFIDDLKNQLFVFKLQGHNDIYYALCDADKRSEMAASKTAEEVERFGKILYSSMDEDPPEALWDVIERGYYNLRSTEGRSYINLYNPNASEAGSQNEENARRRKEVLSQKGIEIARRGDMQKVRDFLREVGDVNWTDENGWTMLHHAAHCGDLDMIRALKDMNANTQVRDNVCGRKPLHIAAREGHTKAVEMFLINNDSVGDVDRSGWTALHYAAWKGDFATVEYLISQNAKTDRDNFLGKNPAHVAVSEGHTDIVEYFLAIGVGINDTDLTGRTMVYYSALAQHYEMTKFLIDRNADVNIKTIFGIPPMDVSAGFANAQLTDLLINSGADIDSRTDAGETMLHRAAGQGLVNVVKMLLEKGANPNIFSKESKTPFDVAVAQQHFESASHLAEKMLEIFRDQAKYREALSIAEKLFIILKTKWGQDDPKTLTSQENVAKMLYEVGRHEEAMQVFDILLNKKQRKLRLLQFETLCTKFEKGKVHVALSEFDKASDIYKEVYDNWKDSLGASHFRTLDVSREIASMHSGKGQFDEALNIFKDVYEKRRMNDLGENDPDTWQAMEDVAVVLINKGENEKGLRVLKHVFEKRKSRMGADHPATLHTGSYVTALKRILENATENATSS